MTTPITDPTTTAATERAMALVFDVTDPSLDCDLYYTACDDCGRASGDHERRDGLAAILVRRGWTLAPDGYGVLCPTCSAT